jgi:hypothetical protein
MNFALGQKIQSGLETAAARTHESELVHNDGRRIQSDSPVDRGFHEYRAAGSRHLHGLAQTLSGTRRFNHPVVSRDRKLCTGNFTDYSGFFGDPQLVCMTAELVHSMSGSLEDLRHKESEFAVTEDSDFSAARERCLIQNLAGCGERFRKNRNFIRDRLRDNVKIDLRQSQKLPKRARVPDNSKNLACRAVPAQAALAPIATPAGKIDFSDNAAAQ